MINVELNDTMTNNIFINIITERKRENNKILKKLWGLLTTDNLGFDQKTQVLKDIAFVEKYDEALSVVFEYECTNK